MITFSRSLLVGGEFLNESLLRLHGILEDHIYAMEIQMDIHIPDGVITAIRGWMKRYATPVCPKAVDVLQKAVGISLREDGWISKIQREIGRPGCQHFAEILVECGRCLDSARIAKAMGETLKNEPHLSSSQTARSWVDGHPEVQGSCLARPKGEMDAH
jgi:Protein of unknown function (DUF2889)